ncbi:MAG: cupin domain-containing protein [Alphaproteobacteria bacterium]|nr:cupin domain-containing protein [Alphaproteobacteria bacterium]
MADDRPKSPAPLAVVAAEVAPRTKPSNYPAPFAARMDGRTKRALGDVFGLRSFGVNLTRLAPGASSALRHAHTVQDELIYVLEGHPSLHTDAGLTRLAPGMCAGFRGGSGDAHRLVNDSDADVVYLEIGDRQPGDGASYPDDDLVATQVDGGWRFTHKDGSAY